MPSTSLERRLRGVCKPCWAKAPSMAKASRMLRGALVRAALDVSCGQAVRLDLLPPCAFCAEVLRVRFPLAHMTGRRV
eukprot:3486899-Pleurochrysis_carterae.AAC.5